MAQNPSGDEALLMLHGWCADSGQFARLIPLLGARCIAPDFRGHGRRRPATTDFGEAELVEDALAAADAAGAERFTVVAVAHAGWVALELARRVPKRVRGVVLLSWLVLDPPPPFLAALQQLQDADAWQAARDGLFAMWTQGVADDGMRGYVHDVMGAHGFEDWARGGREIASAYARNGRPLDAFGALPNPPRTLHLYAQPPLPEYLAAQQEFAALHPWFSVQRIDGAAGHFPGMEVPELTAASINAFVAAPVAS